MQFLIRTLVKKETRRRILATVFLVVFLAEAGSHGFICSGQISSEGQSVAASESGHDDPCQTLVLCSDNKQKDQQLPSFSHDSMQHNAMFDRRWELLDQIGSEDDARIPYSTAHALFRPPSPPFHPPELS